ncbi:uncharacterized protein LOC134187889 [Corticium candelabrum]|uniref:uncharacterized protein LOC134187889 n=1 Tax=Corticium candelabrum TaxID=121492 RepID=UPI002E26DA9B|nr:uncharacterized protein LOC134187889 [Corticium candelabrum]
MTSRVLLFLMIICVWNDIKKARALDDDVDMESIVRSVYIDSSHHAHIQHGGVKIWRFDIAAEECESARVHLDTFVMAPGDYVLVYGLDANGRTIGMERFEGKGWRDAGDVNSRRVWAKHIVLELHATNGQSHFHLTYVHYSDCYYERLGRPNKLCSGGAGWKNLVCFKNDVPQLYQLGDAVFKLRYVKNGTARIATGWKATNDGRCMTNNHVVDTEQLVRTLELLYKYDATTCSSSTGTVNATYHGDRMIQTNVPLDFTIFTVRENITRVRCLPRTTSIPPTTSMLLIVHHPNGEVKKLSYKSNVDAGGVCKRNATCSTNNVCYNCDTVNGSSGAPVIYKPNSTSSFYVFALHVGALASGCPNRGRKMSKIIPAAGNNLGVCT